MCPSAGWKDRGLIPAHAGKTTKGPRSSASSWAHPRSRGENFSHSQNRQQPLGSSPLTRGKLKRGQCFNSGGGLIPAHAGKTPDRRSGRRPGRAHPRSRGENAKKFMLATPVSGSSPLTRGKPTLYDAPYQPSGLIPAHAGKTAGLHRGRRCPRLIPAHAGKTTRAATAPAPARAHPRSRGENSLGLVTMQPKKGSSPLTRGKRVPGAEVRRRPGLIPAHAGKTQRSRRSCPDRRAHPRSRGENVIGVSGAVCVRGSSPLTRGKRSGRRGGPL